MRPEIRVDFEVEPWRLELTGLISRNGFPLARVVWSPKYRICIGGVWGSIDIPAGFLIDGASIPAIAHAYRQPFDPRVLMAAGPHDWMYTTRLFEDRWIADEIFRLILLKMARPSVEAEFSVAVREATGRALEGDPLNRIDSWVMGRAVRLGGGSAWKDTEPDMLADRALAGSEWPPIGARKWNEWIDYGDYSKKEEKDVC